MRRPQWLSAPCNGPEAPWALLSLPRVLRSALTPADTWGLSKCESEADRERAWVVCVLMGVNMCDWKGTAHLTATGNGGEMASHNPLPSAENSSVLRKARCRGLGSPNSQGDGDLLFERPQHGDEYCHGGPSLTALVRWTNITPSDSSINMWSGLVHEGR